VNPSKFVSRLTRKSRSNFFYAFLLLPRAQREAIFAVYAFCRIVDDAVDEGADRGVQRAELARWREEIARVYEGRAEHPAGQRLQVALRRFPIPRAALEEIIAGVEMDLDHPTYETWDTLYPYCYRVASAVGLCCIEIFGYTDPRAREYAVNLGEWPYDVAKAKELLKEAGYPNGFETDLWSAYNHTTAQKVSQFLQQQLQQVGIRTKITLLEAGQRVEKVESWQDPKTTPVRLLYVGWSTSTGEADWALRPLLGGDSWPPKLFNTAYYKSDQVDNDIKKAQLTTDSAEKAKLYKDAQETIWHDAPWVPLVVEKLLSVHNKRLTGVYVIPDASFNFTDIDLK
jgi:ABC-type transport system substrate-binding protein